MSKKATTTPAAKTDRARKAAIAEIQDRLKGKGGKTAKPKKVSCLDAAAQLLAGSDKPMKAKEMIEAMAAKGLWKSPGGKTPESSLYAAMIREIAAKGTKARFVKADKGLFAAGKGA